MAQQQTAPSGQQQYERDLERYRNESTQISESLFRALERKRTSRVWTAVARWVMLAFRWLMRLFRNLTYDLFRNFITTMFGGWF